MKWHILILSLLISYQAYADSLSDELEFILNILDKEEAQLIDAAKEQPVQVVESQIDPKDENPLGLDEVSLSQSSTDDFVDLEKE